MFRQSESEEMYLKAEKLACSSSLALEPLTCNVSGFHSMVDFTGRTRTRKNDLIYHEERKALGHGWIASMDMSRDNREHVFCITPRIGQIRHLQSFRQHSTLRILRQCKVHSA